MSAHESAVAGGVPSATDIIDSMTEDDRADILDAIQTRLQTATIRDLLAVLYVLRASALRRTVN